MTLILGSVRSLGFCALAAALTLLGCATVQPHDVRARVLPLKVPAPDSPEGRRAALLTLLRAIHVDFGTKLTPRQIASQLNVPAHSSEPLGVWVFEPQGAMFEVDADAISMDSPVDWLRVTMQPELAIHLADLTQLFSHDYDVLGGGAKLMAVEFTSNGRMHIAAELRNDRTAYTASAPVVSVRLRRPGYDPEQRAHLGRADQGH